jgi:hypothetical protein
VVNWSAGLKKQVSRLDSACKIRSHHLAADCTTGRGRGDYVRVAKNNVFDYRVEAQQNRPFGRGPEKKLLLVGLKQE